MLQPQGSAVERDQLVVQAVPPRPGVVLLDGADLGERRPVRHDPDLMGVDAPLLERLEELLGDRDDRLARFQQPCFEPHVVLPDGSAGQAELCAEEVVGGLGNQVLDPEDESGALCSAGVPELLLRVERHVAADDDIGSESGRAAGHQLSHPCLEEPAAQKAALVENGAGRDPLDLEIRGIAGPHGELAFGRLEIGKMQMQHAMAAMRQRAAELHLKGVTGIVANDEAHARS